MMSDLPQAMSGNDFLEAKRLYLKAQTEYLEAKERYNQAKKAFARYNGYEYDELEPGQIRVLDILPKISGNDYLEVTFRTISLNPPSGTGLPVLRKPLTGRNKPTEPFVTLSYTWGTPSAESSQFSRTVYVEGAPFAVTKNLYDALEHIRDVWANAATADKSSLESWFTGIKDAPKTELISLLKTCPPIWADALCINQTNTTEQSEQVKLMGEIYRRSSHLVIWLGQEYVTTDFEGGCLDRSAAEPLSLMTRSPWFKRRWVIQESVLKDTASSLLLNNRLLDRDTFSRGLHAHTIHHRVTLLKDEVWDKSSKKTLFENLQEYAKTECCDPRDRVYALLSISSDGDAFQVDYNKTTEQVYADVVWHYAKDLATQLTFAAQIVAQTGITSCASWVPDWREFGRPANAVPHELVVEECTRKLASFGIRYLMAPNPRLPKFDPIVHRVSSGSRQGIRLSVLFLKRTLILPFRGASLSNSYKFNTIRPKDGMFCLMPSMQAPLHIIPAKEPMPPHTEPCYQLCSSIETPVKLSIERRNLFFEDPRDLGSEVFFFPDEWLDPEWHSIILV